MYVILSVKQHSKFFKQDMESTTADLAQAGRFTETHVNSNLEFFDNGEQTQAVLVSRLRHLTQALRLRATHCD